MNNLSFQNLVAQLQTFSVLHPFETVVFAVLLTLAFVTLFMIIDNGIENHPIALFVFVVLGFAIGTIVF
jgi:hypothetical protein